MVEPGRAAVTCEVCRSEPHRPDCEAVKLWRVSARYYGGPAFEDPTPIGWVAAALSAARQAERQAERSRILRLVDTTPIHDGPSVVRAVGEFRERLLAAIDADAPGPGEYERGFKDGTEAAGVVCDEHLTVVRGRVSKAMVAGEVIGRGVEYWTGAADETALLAGKVRSASPPPGAGGKR